MQIEKPWGWYSDILRTDDYVLKTISVAPKQRLSYQVHKHRGEFWVVLEGTPIVQRDDDYWRLKKGDTHEIEMGEWHRLINDTPNHVVVLELQHGRCNEDDIIRLEDDYDRTGQTQ